MRFLVRRVSYVRRKYTYLLLTYLSRTCQWSIVCSQLLQCTVCRPMLLQKWRKLKLFNGAVPCTLNHRIKFCNAWLYHGLFSDASSTLALTYPRIIWEEANVLRYRNGLKEWVSEIFCCFTEGFRKTARNTRNPPLFWDVTNDFEKFGSRLLEGRYPLHLQVLTSVRTYWRFSDTSVSKYSLTHCHVPENRKILHYCWEKSEETGKDLHLDEV
jgi:hypothetical protein